MPTAAELEQDRAVNAALIRRKMDTIVGLSNDVKAAEEFKATVVAKHGDDTVGLNEEFNKKIDELIREASVETVRLADLLSSKFNIWIMRPVATISTSHMIERDYREALTAAAKAAALQVQISTIKGDEAVSARYQSDVYAAKWKKMYTDLRGLSAAYMDLEEKADEEAKKAKAMTEALDKLHHRVGQLAAQLAEAVGYKPKRKAVKGTALEQTLTLLEKSVDATQEIVAKDKELTKQVKQKDKERTKTATENSRMTAQTALDAKDVENAEGVSVGVQVTPDDEPADATSVASPVQSGDRAFDADALAAFCGEVSATLTAAQAGYDSVEALLGDLDKDTGLDGEQQARSFGYASFSEFLHSEAMASMVQVRFSAKRNSGNAHILEEQEKSNAQFGELYRKNKKMLNRKSEEARQLSQRCQALRHEVTEMTAHLREKTAQLENMEVSFKCLMCQERNIEIVYGCGHGACEACNTSWTWRNPSNDPASRFRPPIPGAPMANAGPPKCPAGCGNLITSQTRFYGNP